ncbi:Oidioi.mRNA.OKI2018_I69.PAR.g8813.t1.cds [Oikopleura dioica]|uniref:Oidioi.mRNA.OKI2018_I69.PAR.g8813.t1.cds n=1 Tax=Oikopleura dioica TaxID=34765 RepID=A0ABN7RHP8_OIKDI|nr:Oidioi.mRNA.OKI2018_I69.PAR.g8813.t1.cds [Oikopleura dioica]
MKICISFLAIVSAQVTDDYCRVREQMADNIKYYGDAIDRYIEQEKTFNELGRCYNSMAEAGVLETDRDWDNRCISSGICREDGSDSRLCCITNDFNQLQQASILLSSHVDALDQQMDNMLSEMLQVESCITGLCYDAKMTAF